jgi:hypothetical protein
MKMDVASTWRMKKNMINSLSTIAVRRREIFRRGGEEVLKKKRAREEGC